MQEIFADGIRSVAVANGVVRIELAQVRRAGDGEAKMSAEPIATLLVPVAAMNGVLTQLSQTMTQLQAQARQQSETTLP